MSLDLDTYDTTQHPFAAAGGLSRAAEPGIPAAEGPTTPSTALWRAGVAEGPAAAQGLTLVHFSAQLERFVCDRGCVARVKGV